MINEEIFEDEIVSIEYIGEEETIDINVDGDRLFYANDILTHNCAVDEVEFDHSHISGGLSKIQTADAVFGIFTSRAMRERGKYQLQLLKTRNSGGVGQKIDLNFDVDTLRITNSDEQSDESYSSPTTQKSTQILNTLQRSSTVGGDNVDTKVPKAEVGSSKLRQLLNNMPEEF